MVATRPLDLLADEVRGLFRKADNAERVRLHAYKEAGERLLEAKAAMKHGQWLPWLKAHGISSQRASEAMRLAGGWEQIPAGGNLKDSLKACRTTDDDPGDCGDAELLRPGDLSYAVSDRPALVIGRVIRDMLRDAQADVTVMIQSGGGEYTVSARGPKGHLTATREALDQAIAALAPSDLKLYCRGACEREFSPEALQDGYCRACRRLSRERP